MPILVSVGHFHRGSTSDGHLGAAPFCSIQNQVAEMKGTRATRWSRARPSTFNQLLCATCQSRVCSGKYGAPTYAVPHAGSTMHVC